ncbi:uncharacterized protein LOC143207744 isoform X2 [Lasioglossum baleicum]|uniref:uncharacterized protein LOC143207744 isoform X2 n=1 Tax=Lasioglossum baleicum TaxID=434251 RepID=UPI003FCDD876
MKRQIPKCILRKKMHMLRPRGNKMSKRKFLDRKRCCFCGLSDDNELEYGKFYEHGDVVTHYYCLLLSSNMEQKGSDDDGILGFLVSDIEKEIRRGKRLACSYCKKSGATLGCCNSRCKKIFHYPCGLRAGSLHQFFGEFRSYCQNHRPRQKVDLKVRDELERIADIKCYICYDNVNPSDIINTIWAPCCKKNTWFHRKCVQQLAMSAGYFFKCPLCNDKKKFQKAMLEYGIFIPRQDASWELEPNAFQDLLYRHDQCDAPICLCPKGRKYTSINAKWELTLCRTCGSQGIHMECGQLKWGTPIWECVECTSILDKSNQNSNVNTILSILQNDSDSEESDSDISVGKESPMPYTINTQIPVETQQPPTIKLRPGPRTFKLKQQYEIAKQMEELQKSNSSQRDIEQTNTILDVVDVEEYTNKKHAPSGKSNLPESGTCKSVTIPSNNDVIMLDSDDEMSASTSSLNDTIVIANIDEPVQSNVFPLKNDVLKDKESDTTIQSSNCFGKEVLHTNSATVRQNDSNNLGVAKSDRLKEHSLHSLQDKESIDLEETIRLNVENDCDSSDSLSNIQISNVISLTTEEFEDVSFVGKRETNSDVRCSLQKPSPRPHSSHSSSDNLNTQLKRTIYHVITNSLHASEDKSKKVRRSLDIQYENEKQSLRANVDINDSSKSNVFRNNALASISNTDITLINQDSNVGNQMHSRMEKHCDVNTDFTDIRTSNIQHAIKKDSSRISNNEIGSTSLKERKEEDGISDSGATSKARNIQTDVRNCDADAGTSPVAAARSGYRILTGDDKISSRKENIRHISLQSETADHQESQTNIEMATVSNPNTIANTIIQRRNRTSESDHYRLIPEYIRLCDLKFRVCNSNNLLMILCNKFSVNINMESSATPRKNVSKFDVSARRTVQQKYHKTHSEISSTLKPESSLHGRTSTPIPKAKDKHGVFISDQPKSYRDDAKENLDPISGSCKSLADNGNNPNEDSNTSNSVYNSSKTIEEDSKWHHRESVNLSTDSENIYNTDELVTHANDKCFRNANSVKQNLRKIGSVESMSNNDLIDAAKSFCANGKPENKKKNVNGNGDHLKISIDLEKIESFIDTNPQLFSNSRRKNEERNLDEVGLLKEWNDISGRISMPNNHIANSLVDESKHLGNFSLSLKSNGNRIAELKSYVNEDNDIKTDSEIISADTTESGTRYFNTFFI